LKRLVIGIAVLVLIAVAGVGAARLYLANFSPDRSRYPVRGIDVSHHQGVIDWQAVAGDDVAFAMIKATEGGDHVDEDFAANLAAAREAGLKVGAYHYFTLCRPGAEQAANFLAVTSRDGPLLPPAIDLEYEGNCSERPAPEILRAEVEAFLGPVEAAFGQQAIFYITSSFYDDYFRDLPRRPLWTRRIAWHPGHDDWMVWQYHDEGRVKGIQGDVDLNVLQGGPDQLTRLAVTP